MSLLDSFLWLRLVQDGAPLLPQPSYLTVLRHAGWALVLAALLSAGAQMFTARRLREAGGMAGGDNGAMGLHSWHLGIGLLVGPGFSDA